MTLKTKIRLQAAGIALLMIAWASIPAFADGWGECDHPRFQEVGCTYPGEQGPPGRDGRDGHDGRDGRDGEDGASAYEIALENGFEGTEEEWLASLVGPAGRDGRDGIDGKDGVVPTEWITETRYQFDRVRDAAAAEAAMDAYLPQYSNQRLHFNAAHVNGRTGIGFGYAYMIDNERNAGLTFAMGHAGSETAMRASFGFEFGSDRPMRLDLSSIAPAAAPEPDGVYLTEAEYDEMLMAQATQEQHNEDIENIEYRIAQQDNLIESLREQHEDDEAEIERLKQEAARLRAEQQEQERIDAARRAAALEALRDKKEDE